MKRRLGLRSTGGWLLAGLLAIGAVLVGPGSATAASPPAAQSAATAAADPVVQSHCRELNNHPLTVRGQTNLYVSHAQCLLKYHYGQDIAVDWIFGPATEQAVRNVQTVCRLQVDGQIGDETWPVLHRHGTC
ncbi:peptidoglycan-binding domain-containing protein [Actinophytocola sediminis]